MAKNSKLMVSILREILPKKLTKSDQRRLAILNAAIETYASLDSKYISYEDIGREAKTSSALIQHYFPDKRELFLTAAKVIRAQLQEMHVTAISKAQNPLEMMEAYVRSAFRWMEQYPNQMKAWLFFLYLCGNDSKLREVHSELTQMGQERIAEMLNMGVAAQVFHIKLPPLVLAKHIQKVISGAALEIHSEGGLKTLKRIENETWDLCAKLLI